MEEDAARQSGVGGFVCGWRGSLSTRLAADNASLKGAKQPVRGSSFRIGRVLCERTHNLSSHKRCRAATFPSAIKALKTRRLCLIFAWGSVSAVLLVHSMQSKSPSKRREGPSVGKSPRVKRKVKEEPLWLDNSRTINANNEQMK